MEPLDIKVGSTYLEMKVEPSGQAHPWFNVKSFIARYLSEYEWVRKRQILSKRYTFYDPYSKLYRIPRHAKNDLSNTLEQCSIIPNHISAEPVTDTKIKFSMRSSFTDRPEQVEAIDFLVNASTSMRCLELQTGLGKTYCAIKAASKLECPTLIITADLTEQWGREVLEKACLNKEDVYFIQGFKSIEYLSKVEDYHPKIIIASLNTIRLYCQNDGLYEHVLPYELLIQKYGIGCKIVDECHLNFHAITIIDLHSNIKHNIYLSATYDRSNRIGKKIFDLIFPKELRYFKPYQKYVNINFYEYILGDESDYKKIRTHKGYSHSKYENSVTSNKSLCDRFMQVVIDPILQEKYILIRKPEQKVLILASTVNMCQKILQYITAKYPEEKSSIYISGVSDEVLETSSIIVSTPKSAGTGTDISNLRTVINTCSFASNPLIKQVLGRLRRLKNGDTPEMTDVYNAIIPDQQRHYQERKSIYLKLGITYNENKLNYI